MKDQKVDVQQLAHHANRLLTEQKLMVFLGAGASLGTDGEIGAPSSNDLRDAIAEQFGLQVNSDSTLRTIADLAVHNSGDEGLVKGFVANQVSDRCVSPLRSHRALALIKSAIVLTTNYDDLVEQAFRDELGQRPVGPRISSANSESENSRAVAQAQTLAVLEGLDPTRKRHLVQFLYYSALIKKDKPVISLDGANLSEADLTAVCTITDPSTPSMDAFFREDLFHER